ncbi:MAG TPA: DUF4062 domain-containing protein [Bryobacteraceae bacterium]|nr:DUF4062 domain-containing protein [Bryobacteraceae bacterium]
MGYDPVVFISSTSEDLEEHREIAAQAALAIGFAPRYMKYFPASGHLPSLPACLEKVDEAEVVVVLVAHRYGWVPDDASNPDHKSITWLECHHARHSNNKEVLAFLVDEKYAWPAELKESYRLVLAKDLPDEEYDQIRKEVRRNEKKLAEFKRELSGYFRGPFTDAAGVRPLVSEALAAWRERHRPATVASAPQDPETYLKALEDRTRQIRITGLSTKRPSLTCSASTRFTSRSPRQRGATCRANRTRAAATTRSRSAASFWNRRSASAGWSWWAIPDRASPRSCGARPSNSAAPFAARARRTRRHFFPRTTGAFPC